MDFLMARVSNDTIIIYNINDMYSVGVGSERFFAKKKEMFGNVYRVHRSLLSEHRLYNNNTVDCVNELILSGLTKVGAYDEFIA